MSSMSADATSIDEPRLSAGKDMRLKCGGVGEMLEKRGLCDDDVLEGLSVVDPSDSDDCFSNFWSLFEIDRSRPVKLVIGLVASAANGLSTMVMARLSRWALR